MLKPLSRGLVRQTRTTRTAIQKAQPRYLSLGPSRTSGSENAVDGTLCDEVLTVMEQPAPRGISHPFLLYKYLEHQAQACREIDDQIHTRQSMPFRIPPITAVWVQQFPHVWIQDSPQYDRELL
jgi:hypothetical protein